jgi:hypothetical protein
VGHDKSLNLNVAWKVVLGIVIPAILLYFDPFLLGRQHRDSMVGGFSAGAYLNDVPQHGCLSCPTDPWPPDLGRHLAIQHVTNAGHHRWQQVAVFDSATGEIREQKRENGSE